MITRASSLITNGTFRYPVKFLALSKTQTKVHPLLCPLPVPATTRKQQQQIQSPLPGGQTPAELFLALPMGSRGWGQASSHPERPHSLTHSLSLLEEGLDPE